MKLHISNDHIQELEDALDAMLADEFQNLEPYWLHGIDLDTSEHVTDDNIH
ncbi:MAG: hypothetical protein ACRBCJ_13800 [Hyphomicrobiaceae bacterium]